MTKLTKKVIANKKRLAALDAKKNDVYKRSCIIKKALMPVAEKPVKIKLFDSEVNESFDIQPKFKCKNGDKLLNLSLKIGNDERFKIDERFVDFKYEENSIHKSNQFKLIQRFDPLFVENKPLNESCKPIKMRQKCHKNNSNNFTIYKDLKCVFGSQKSPTKASNDSGSFKFFDKTEQSESKIDITHSITSAKTASQIKKNEMINKYSNFQHFSQNLYNYGNHHDDTIASDNIKNVPAHLTLEKRMNMFGQPTMANVTTFFMKPEHFDEQNEKSNVMNCVKNFCRKDESFCQPSQWELKRKEMLRLCRTKRKRLLKHIRKASELRKRQRFRLSNKTHKIK